jgi:hypothetical protein
MNPIDGDLHEAAEAILIKHLAAQGRLASDYTLIEYAAALDDAQALGSRVLAAQAIDTGVDQGVFTRDEANGFLTLYQLEPEATRDVLSYWGVSIPDRDAERRDPPAGLAEHQAAERLLVAEGRVDQVGNPHYTKAEYLEALQRVGYRDSRR